MGDLSGTGQVKVNSGLTLEVGNLGLTSTYSGVISAASGTPALTKVGTGTTTLTGANTYTGATTISAGTLQLGNANAVQSSTVTISTSNGLAFTTAIGTFNLGGLSGASNQTLLDTGGIAVAMSVGGNNANTTYSGTLSGSGSLIKVGTGTLSLSNSNSFTGGLVIKAGTVAGTSGGGGAIASAAFGSGTITIGDATAGLNAALTVNDWGSNYANPITVASGARNAHDQQLLE